MNWPSSIPNMLSSLRILIALVFPIVPPPIRIHFLILALLTEYADGALARRFDWVSALGEILDPIADRILACSVGLTLVAAGIIPFGFLLLLFIRDIIVSFGFSMIVILGRNQGAVAKFLPNGWGKLATALQYLAFMDALLSGSIHLWMLVINVVISSISAFSYARRYFSSAPIEMGGI